MSNTPDILPEMAEHRPAPDLYPVAVPDDETVPAVRELSDHEMIVEMYAAMMEIRAVVSSISPKTVDKVAKLAGNPLFAGLFGGN